MNNTPAICRELQLNQNQMDKYESIVLLDTLLFLMENGINMEEEQ